MKTIHKFLLLFMAVAVSSCGDSWLNLEPANAVQTDKAIKTLTDAKASIIGLYSILKGPYSHGGRYTYYADAAGDDMRANGGTKRVATIYTYKSTSENSPSTYWSVPYSIIRNANNILAIIDNIEAPTDADKATRDYIKGQALMFRALSHFDLTCIYGYPYLKDNGKSWGTVITMEVIPNNAKPLRATVKECYDVIITDLVNAIPLMKTKAAETAGLLNKSTAQLLLSRVYLYCGKYQEAYDMAKQVIDGAGAAGFSLWSSADYASGIIWKSKLRTEGLFELAYSATDQSDKECVPFLMNDKSDGYDDMIYSKSFMAAFDPADIRKASISKKVGKNLYCVKNAGPTGKVGDANIIIYRLSEAYLNAAEASVHLTNQAIKDQGRVYFNAIHTRAGLPEAKTDLTVDQVLQERRFELVGEGHRAFDLLRNNKHIVRTGDDHLSEITTLNGNQDLDWNNYHIVLAIPKAEVDTNPKIQQNTDY